MRADCRGFTLVELTVAMAVSALCVTLALGAWLQFRAATLAKEKRYSRELECESRVQAVYNKLKGARLVEFSGAECLWQLANGRSWNMAELDSVLGWRMELEGENGSTERVEDARLVKVFWSGVCRDGMVSEWRVAH